MNWIGPEVHCLTHLPNCLARVSTVSTLCMYCTYPTYVPNVPSPSPINRSHIGAQTHLVGPVQTFGKLYQTPPYIKYIRQVVALYNLCTLITQVLVSCAALTCDVCTYLYTTYRAPLTPCLPMQREHTSRAGQEMEESHINQYPRTWGSLCPFTHTSSTVRHHNPYLPPSLPRISLITALPWPSLM